MRKFVCFFMLFVFNFGCSTLAGNSELWYIEREVKAKGYREHEFKQNYSYNCQDLAEHFRVLAEAKGYRVEKRVSFNPKRCEHHMYVRVYKGEEFIKDYLDVWGNKDQKENENEFWDWWFTKRPKLCKGA